jgi:hypothetical protein
MVVYASSKIRKAFKNGNAEKPSKDEQPAKLPFA